MSVFNPEAFLNTEHNEALDTQVIPVPEGDWTAQVKELKPRVITTKSGEERALMDVVWTMLDDEVVKKTKRNEPIARQTIFLDLTEEGHLDMSEGRNINLGQLRASLGQNKKGKAWKPTDMVGQIAMISIKHNVDENDPEKLYVNVTRVTKAA